MSEQVTLIAVATAKPGQEEELGRRLKALVEPTRAERGNINYDLHRSRDDEAVWMLYENWRSQADLDQHFETPHLQGFLGSMHEVLDRELELRFFQMASERAALAVG